VIQIYNNNNTGPSGTFAPAGSSSQFSFSDPDAASALYNLGKSYDFFMSEFSRNSYDNAGASLIAVVRFTWTPGTPMQNAFWSGAAGSEVPLRIVRGGREKWLRVNSVDRRSILKKPSLQ
jgi:Zn-dependent metalloprotease